MPLDRPGDEQGRDVVLRRIERFDEQFHAMAAEVAEQGRECRIVIGRQKRRSTFAEVRLDALPERRSALIVQG